MERIAIELLAVAKELVAGVPVPPPRMVDVIYDWAVSNLAAKRLAYELDYINYLKSAPTGDMSMLKKSVAKAKVLKKLSRGGKSKWRKLKREFPVDLRGWKYADLVSSAPSKLKVELFGDSLGTSSWTPSSGVMKLKTGMINVNNFWELKNSIEHELLHWAQTDLIGDEFGMSPRKMRDRGVIQRERHEDISQKETHSLDDLEFYPMIQSMIREYEHQELGPEEFIKSSKFFQHLKRRNKRKWVKAVNEFLKQVT